MLATALAEHDPGRLTLHNLEQCLGWTAACERPGSPASSTLAVSVPNSLLYILDPAMFSCRSSPLLPAMQFEINAMVPLLSALKTMFQSHPISLLKGQYWQITFVPSGSIDVRVITLEHPMMVPGEVANSDQAQFLQIERTNCGFLAS